MKLEDLGHVRLATTEEEINKNLEDGYVTFRTSQSHFKSAYVEETKTVYHMGLHKDLCKKKKGGLKDDKKGSKKTSRAKQS